MPLPVSDIASNAQENIAHAAEILRRSRHRQDIFVAVYTNKKKVKSVSELMRITSLSRKRVLDAGKYLADNRIVISTKVESPKKETAYGKIDFYQSRKNKIINLFRSPSKLDDFPTKRNPKNRINTVTIKLRTQRARVHLVTIDDLNVFRKSQKIRRNEILGDRVSEKEFKKVLQKLIGEFGFFKDWGGETNDLFTTRIVINNKRVSAAFALKGPGTKGKLTPGKMGKNGDQIQRLFESPAQLFIVQYCRQIDQSVLSQMKQLAYAKSLLQNKDIWYGIIDGQDSYRIMLGYPKAFKYIQK